jgi:hypothetical protein
MCEDGGIQDLANEESLDFNGFAIGFGAGWEFKAFAGPFVLTAGAKVAVGIGTRPWYLAGIGRLWGEIDLGPVSLGVSAEVKAQLSQAIKRFELEACARVRLLFVEIKGCVKVAIGDPAPAPIPDAESPIRGIHLTDRYTRELKRAEGIPVVWPDALPVIEFGSWVETALPATSSFKGLPAMPTPARGGWVGTEELEYYFRLVGLDLVREDMGAVVAGPLSAIWAQPRHTPAWGAQAPAAGARELVLLDWYSAGWARNLADGGASAGANDPAKYPGDLCKPPRRPERGWAIGETAFRDSTGRPVLPAADPSTDPLRSTFQMYGPADAGDDLAIEAADLGGFFFPGGAVAFDNPIGVGGRIFAGAYWLPTVTRARQSDMQPKPTFVLTASMPLLDARIILALDTRRSEALNDGFVPDVTGIRDTGAKEFWPPVRIAAVDGFTFYEYRSTGSAGPWVAIRLAHSTFRPEPAAGVLGVEAMTATARDTAKADADARAAEHDRQKQVAATPPGEQKPLLDPGVTYKIRTTLEWQARRSARSGGGTKGPTNFVTREERFRIATEGAFGEDPARVQTDESVFDPRGLTRYVCGMSPADGADFVFRDDPMRVHYAVGYVEALAAKYGRKLELRVRRVDPPPGQTTTGFVDWKMLATILGPLLDMSELPAVDQRWNAEVRNLAIRANPCFAPEVGATATAAVQLEPRAHYELRLMAMKSGETPVEIRRVVFTTSRYRDPMGLLVAIGFAGPSPAKEVLVPSTGALPTLGDGDAAQEAAFRALGLDPWPVAKGPAVYALWEPAGQIPWLRGVLLELDEPIHRPGRLEITGLSAGGHTCFVLRNASGTRVLGLFATPIVPSFGTITVTIQRFVSGTNSSSPDGAPLTLSMPLTLPPMLQRDFI